MGDIVQETLDEMRGGLFARWFERSMTNISDLIGEIGSVVGPEFRFEGGMYVTCTKMPEFMPKDKLQELFAAVVDAFGEIEPDALKAAIEQVENFKDCYADTIRQLYVQLDTGIRYFKNEVSSIDLVNAATAVLLPYIELLRAPARGEPYDREAVHRAGVELLEAITPLIDDVYRDETIPPYDVPEPTDAPVSFLPPDPSEIPGHLPSKAEAKNFLDDWVFGVKGCAGVFMHLDPGEESLVEKDCIARLWGYSERICQSQRYKNRQACRMPRIALCPFYDILFRLVDCLFCAAKKYEARQLDGVCGSASIKSTNWSVFPLPRLMTQVLRFAPREYFSEDCHHHAYMMLARDVLFKALDRVSLSIPAESRFTALQQIDRIKREFDAFVDKLHKPASGTERSYAAEVDAIINPFRDAFLDLASVLKAVEDQIEYDHSHPKKDDQVLEKLDELKEGQKALSKGQRTIKDDIKGIRGIIQRFFDWIPRIFAPKKGITREQVENTLDLEKRFDKLKRFTNKDHLEQMKQLVRYSLKHPLAMPVIMHKHQDLTGLVQVPKAIDALFDQHGEKWAKLPNAWRDTEEGKDAFCSSAYALMGKPEKDPFRHE